ncbi:RNA polymerase factor sigma-54 [Thiobacter aerophilum]|uniref:RNA polymerase sigma-54 factor n=1 Tax=Thiobacter aerophilum TaxID=3121275 RepID=A0ABV0EC69_9BURK
MKHSLQLKLSQQLTLTPQLQQSIRLLQLSTLELNQELEVMLQENPLLERYDLESEEEGGAPALDGFATTLPAPITEEAVSKVEVEGAPESAEVPESLWDQDIPSGPRGEDEEGDFPQLATGAETLREHLLWQLNLLTVSERDKSLIALIIDALDEDGYLKQPLSEIAEMLPPELEVDPLELTAALKHLQNMDPPGVGARNLAECLVLQLENSEAPEPARDLAINIAREHLDLLAARDFNKLKKLLQCSDELLREAHELITHLTPRPGAAYGRDETRYIVHDVEVRKIKDRWLVRLNPEAMPKLRINRVYADILRRNRNATSKELASQLQEARWLIKNVQQRFDTILRVSQAIVDRQRHFLEHGEVAMRPLVLREIAEAVGLHESTVSRVTTQKYMLTPRGIYELKYFFGSHVATESGGACSATAIRALIKQLVAAEDRTRPLSDAQIADILAKQGIIVARRTIAKYRESLQIPPASLRKAF